MSLRERVHPIVDDALGNTSYLVDIGRGEALVVDPRRDIDVYLDHASRHSLRIVAILETHLHADFVSGAREVVSATGAALYAAADAGLRHPHTPVSPTDRFALGDVTIEVIGTPGHTTEHVAFLATLADEHAIFSGGSLIAGGAARTDLMGDDRTEALARAQYASIRRIAELPDATMLFPTHGGGSFCSTTTGASPSQLIGDERRGNPLLAFADEEAFVKAFVGDFGSYPPYFLHLREVNQVGTPLLSALTDPPHLPGAEAQAQVDAGAWLVDTRTVGAWQSAHPPGAISIALRPSFASWLGWVVPFGEPVIFLMEPSQIEDATRLSRRIGYDSIQGWTTIDDWQASGLPTERSESITVESARALGVGALLDVRQSSEFMKAHIEGAQHLELGDIVAGKVPSSKAVVAYCTHGERSSTAVSLLARQGITVANLAGGMSAWRRAGSETP